MAIAYDTGTDLGSANGNITASHTCTGSNLLLVVGIYYIHTDTITGVTYNGVSMTRINSPVQVNSDVGRITFFGLQGPASGANNVVITKSGSTDNCYGVATSYTGAAQGGGADSSATNTNNSTASFTLTTTTVADNCWTFGFWRNGSVTSIAGAGTTVRKTNANASNSVGIGDSGGVITPAGSNVLTITSALTYWGGITSSYAPYVAASGPANLKTYNTNLKANIKSINTNLIANVKSLDTNV